MEIPILKNLFQKTGKEIIESVGDTLDKVFTNKEELATVKNEIEKEINRHIETLNQNSIEAQKSVLNDIANSREANVKIQESDKSSWLSKNIGYLIDITLLFAVIVMMYTIFYKTVPETNKEIFYMAFGAILSFLGTSITWHRGSSHGSVEKQKLIDKFLRK